MADHLREVQAREAATRLLLTRGDDEGALSSALGILAQFPRSPIAFLALKVLRNREDLAGVQGLCDLLAQHGALNTTHLIELAVTAATVGDVEVATATGERVLADPTLKPESKAQMASRVHRASEGRIRVRLEELPPPEAPSPKFRILPPFDDVIRDVDAAIAEGRTIDHVTLHGAMRALAAQGRVDEVETLMERCLSERLPNPSFAFGALIKAQLRADRPADAQATLDDAVAADHGRPELYELVIRDHIQRRSFDAAARLLTTVADTHEYASPGFHQALADILVGGSEATVQPLFELLADRAFLLPEHLIQQLRDDGRPWAVAAAGRLQPWLPTLTPGQNRNEVDRIIADCRTSTGVQLAQQELQTERSRAGLSAQETAQIDIAVLRGWGRLRKPEEAQRHAEHMVEAGRPLRTDHIHVLMTAWGTMGAADEVESLFGDALTSGMEITGHHLAALILAHSRSNRPEQAERYLSWARRLVGAPHPRYHFGPIVEAYQRLNSPADVRRLLQEMEEDGVTPDAFNTTAAMQAWSNEGNVAEVEALRDSLLSQGSRLDEYHYAIILRTYADASDVEGATTTFDAMEATGVRASTFHYEHLMRAHLNSGNPHEVERILDRMIEQGVAPDAHNLDTLAEAASRARSRPLLDRIEGLFDEESAHDALAVAALARALAMGGEPDRAEALLTRSERVVTEGAQRADLARTIARCFAFNGDAVGTERLLKVAVQNSPPCPGDDVTRASLAARTGATATTRELYETSLVDAELTATELAVLLGALANAGMVEAASRTIDRLQVAGAVRARQLGLYLDMLTRYESAAKVEQRFREFEPHVRLNDDEATYLHNLVLRAYSWDDDAESVERVVNDMVRKGLNLDRFSMGTLEAARRRQGAFTDPKFMVRAEASREWQELTVVLDDVVHELSQWVGQLGGLISASMPRPDGGDSEEDLGPRVLQMAGIVNQIAERLDEYSAVGGVDATGEDVDVRELITWATARVEPEAARFGIMIAHVTETRDQLPMTVAGNEFVLRLVLKALLNNAVDALAGVGGTGPQPRIWINAFQTSNNLGEWIDIIVRDNGPGVPNSERERIFERGYSTKRSRGLGLGLSLVATVAESLGGTVTLSPGSEEGAEFWLRLRRTNQPEGRP